jgi:hypothetical protein
MYQDMELRQVLGQELDRYMALDERIVVIDADLSKSNGTYALRQKYPDRALDVGIAEQNMAGIAAGLAAYGFIPMIFSFTPFVTRRMCDQLAVSIAYARRNVKIVGTDPGILAELNGATHMSDGARSLWEKECILPDRPLSVVQVFSPGITEAAAQIRGPNYRSPFLDYYHKNYACSTLPAPARIYYTLVIVSYSVVAGLIDNDKALADGTPFENYYVHPAP